MVEKTFRSYQIRKDIWIKYQSRIYFPNFLMKESFDLMFRKTSSPRKFRALYSSIFGLEKLSGIKNERKSWFEKESSETISSISSPWSKRSRRSPPIERWKRSSHTEELIEESRTKFFRISLTTRTSRRGNKRNEP